MIPADDGKSPFGEIPRHAGKLDRESVHHIRKGTKQLRARLQLMRQLDDRDRKTEQLRQAVKELARLLAGQRDADVLHGLMEELKADCDDREVRALLDSLQGKLTGRHLPVDTMNRIVKLVREIEHGSHQLAPLGSPAADIDRLLAARLQRLLAAGPALLASSDWPALHDWRKQVKKLMYQVDMKPDRAPGDIVVRNHLDQLGDCLGKINDLCMLENFVRHQEADVTRAHTVDTFGRLLQLLDRRRQARLAACNTCFEALRRLK